MMFNRLIKLSNINNINKSFYSTLKIYTKTGDKGTSSLYNGERRYKDDQIFQVLGSVDELSSQLGVAKEHLHCLYQSINNSNDSTTTSSFNKIEKQDLTNRLIQEIEIIQCCLLDIGSVIATPEYSEDQFKKRTPFNDIHTQNLESWIDDYTNHLEPLKNFILPGGGISSATLQLSRSICRRSERDLISMINKESSNSNSDGNNNNLNNTEPATSQVMRFINRLSDYLFTIARLSNKIEELEESVYRRPPIDSNSNNNTTTTNKYQRKLEKHSNKK